MSNSSFKISNEINDSTIVASSINASSISYDRLEYLGNFSTITPNGGNYVFTSTDLSLMAK